MPQEITFLAGDACLYSVVKRSALSLGWKLVGESAPEKAKRNCHVIWVDRAFVNDKLFLTIQPWQRINHFPGMSNICRKTRLAQNLELMRKKFPHEFAFYPPTFILPQNFAALKTLFINGQSKHPFIIKPDGSAQGKGIFLTKSIAELQDIHMSCVAQQYIRNPLLIDNKKFDLRIYVLVMSCSPLRLYLFRDGLVRMCTEEYQTPNSRNMSDRCMHLTNYAVNKRSDKYEREVGTDEQAGLGSKRSISWLLSWLSEERSEVEANAMWSKIGDICVMTVLSILPTLQREYINIWTEQPDTSSTDDKLSRSQCFEILGFDIMVDTTLRPYLIEVNHLPSWGTDSPLDDSIKSRVITNALKALNVRASDKKQFESARKKRSRIRLGQQSAGYTADSAKDDANLQNDTKSIGGNFRVAKRQQPFFFESNSAERRIHAIYAKYAPDKISRIPELLNRFRGYEEWLVMKVQSKYEPKKDVNTDEASESSHDSDCSSNENPLRAQHLKFQEEERVLEGYDRIYPPKAHGWISSSRFKEMEAYVAEVDAVHQRRLLCPLQQIRGNGDASSESTIHGWSRADGWVGGNIHIRQAKKQPKIIGPPTKKQIEFADRLSRGFSVGDEVISHPSMERRKIRLLRHDFVYEEANPFYQLIDRVTRIRELSKEARQRAEKKLSKRLETGVAVKQQVVDLELPIDQCLRIRDEKFYLKKKHH
ncbi:hypothetical protein HJC23_005872 [Cyclotella cryptica]|uniref:Uncharacterized protein n=1 Tax=Cyclotella cryptica TaxID=29204 RepID=A0ABD3QZF6_9STRA|eukprot:CCRYP_000400-RA/>CCRYP_000400-RA protein AED:0.03 eAED:0.03 QI:0/0/0/1/1/1/4/0/706